VDLDGDFQLDGRRPRRSGENFSADLPRTVSPEPETRGCAAGQLALREPQRAVFRKPVRLSAPRGVLERLQTRPHQELEKGHYPAASVTKVGPTPGLEKPWRCLPPTHSPPDHQIVVRSELVQHLGQRGSDIQGTKGGVDEHPVAGGGAVNASPCSATSRPPVQTRAYPRM